MFRSVRMDLVYVSLNFILNQYYLSPFVFRFLRCWQWHLVSPVSPSCGKSCYHQWTNRNGGREWPGVYSLHRDGGRVWEQRGVHWGNWELWGMCANPVVGSWQWGESRSRHRGGARSRWRHCSQWEWNGRWPPWQPIWNSDHWGGRPGDCTWWCGKEATKQTWEKKETSRRWRLWSAKQRERPRGRFRIWCLVGKTSEKEPWTQDEAVPVTVEEIWKDTGHYE